VSKPWAKKDISLAKYLNFITNDFLPRKELTREEAAMYVKKLTDLL
jgi:hypothetical protein